MRLISKAVLILLLSTTFLVAESTLAFDKYQKEKEEIMQELDLTSEQKVKIEALKEGKKDIRQIANEVVKLRGQLHLLLENPDISESIILAKSKQISDKILLKHEERIKHALELRKILTPEQFKKLLNRMEKKFENLRPPKDK